MTLREAVVHGISATRWCGSFVLLLLLLRDSHRASFALLMWLVASDFLDGILARHWGVSSKEGYILDGLADRAAYLSILLFLVYQYQVSLFLVLGVTLRDVGLYGARALNSTWHHEASRSPRVLPRLNALIFRLTLSIFLAHYYLLKFNLAINLPGITLVVGHWLLWIYLLVSFALLAIQVSKELQRDLSSEKS